MLAVCVTACGGGGSSDNNSNPPVPGAAPPLAGQLKAVTLLSTISASDIAQALNTSTDTRIQGLNPAYSVVSYRIEYLSSDGQGQSVRASGLLSVPVKPAGAKSPLLSYQHGTLYRDAQAPSNHAVASEVAVMLASLGYIVMAPDYVGYGVSRGTPHPYLLAAPSAAATIDLLTAAKTWRAGNNVNDNGQLFLTGYSEGGYVSMAAHRALQAANAVHLQSLRLVVAGAGAYNVQLTLDNLLSEVRAEQPALGLLLNPGLLRFLGPDAQHALAIALLAHLLPSDADVVFDTWFIDSYLADDTQAIAQRGSVHDWKPNLPIQLYHGRDDRTVPYASSLSALQAMRARGAGDLVSLTDCPAVPADHIPCVPFFLSFMLGQLASRATDL